MDKIITSLSVFWLVVVLSEILRILLVILLIILLRLAVLLIESGLRSVIKLFSLIVPIIIDSSASLGLPIPSLGLEGVSLGLPKILCLAVTLLRLKRILLLAEILLVIILLRLIVILLRLEGRRNLVLLLIRVRIIQEISDLAEETADGRRPSDIV